MSGRPFNVVVWGASGFTGRLVCRHLARDYQGKVKWAMVGRNEAKMQDIRAELAKEVPEAAAVDIVLADAADKESLAAMAGKADVVIATAGPFARFGRPVVEACIAEGTHYCDITGEIPFVRNSIETMDAPAKEAGVKIVHMCGFDSVPSDLAALLTADYIRREYDADVERSEGVLMAAGGGISGGTVESGIHLQSLPARDRAIAAHPYALDPERWHQGVADGPDKGMNVAPMTLPVAKAQTAPFIMAMVNEPVVRRSRALLGYGEAFKYTERMYTSSWLASAATGAMTAFFGLLLPLAAKFPFLRSKLPMPGDGPTQEQREAGFFHFANFARGVSKAGKLTPPVVSCVKDMHRDGGYWSTSRMILESALCLALDQQALQSDAYAARHPAGVLTPAAALGFVLVQRLKNAGYELEVGPYDGTPQVSRRNKADA